MSALIELCNKRKIMQPDFVMVHHSGPDHRKNFLFKVGNFHSVCQSYLVFWKLATICTFSSMSLNPTQLHPALQCFIIER